MSWEKQILNAVNRTLYLVDEKKRQNRFESTKDVGFTTPEQKEIKGPSEMRRKGTKDEATDEINYIIEQAYYDVFLQYETEMQKHVLDIDFDKESMRKEFAKSLCLRVMEIVDSKDQLSREYIEKGKQVVRKARYDDNKLGACYLTLLNAYTGKKLKSDDLKRAQNIDVNVFTKFRMYYYAAMKKACSMLEDMRIRIAAIHYWHAVIRLDAHPNEFEIKELCSDGAVGYAEATAMMEWYEILKSEEKIYEIKIKEYLNGESIIVPNEDEAFLEYLLEQANVFMLEEKLQ